MSKVDEWLNKINETRNMTPPKHIFKDGSMAYVDVDGGPIKISAGELMVRIEKEDALKFGNWIIENYGDKSEDQKNHEQHVKFFVEAMGEETNKNSDVDNE